MAHTNSTENYGLPQWIGTDKPTFLGDFNTAFGVIDGAMKDNADAATSAVATANSASAVASSANTNATTALSTANEAKADAASAVTTASTANTKATQAQTDAASALHASAGNSIENLAPAYDPTLTYNVGDLVTYIDAQNSGKMYKCIVAVNTPMEFNINYWDDVTTSEVYSQSKRVILREVIADGVKNSKALIEELCNFNRSAYNLKDTSFYLWESQYNGIYNAIKFDSEGVNFVNKTFNPVNGNLYDSDYCWGVRNGVGYMYGRDTYVPLASLPASSSTQSWTSGDANVPPNGTILRIYMVN